MRCWKKKGVDRKKRKKVRVPTIGSAGPMIKEIDEIKDDRRKDDPREELRRREAKDKKRKHPDLFREEDGSGKGSSRERRCACEIVLFYFPRCS